MSYEETSSSEEQEKIETFSSFIGQTLSTKPTYPQLIPLGETHYPFERSALNVLTHQIKETFSSESPISRKRRIAIMVEGLEHSEGPYTLEDLEREVATSEKDPEISRKMMESFKFLRSQGIDIYGCETPNTSITRQLETMGSTGKLIKKALGQYAYMKTVRTEEEKEKARILYDQTCKLIQNQEDLAEQLEVLHEYIGQKNYNEILTEKLQKPTLSSLEKQFPSPNADKILNTLNQFLVTDRLYTANEEWFGLGNHLLTERDYNTCFLLCGRKHLEDQYREEDELFSGLNSIRGIGADIDVISKSLVFNKENYNSLNDSILIDMPREILESPLVTSRETEILERTLTSKKRTSRKKKSDENCHIM